jgi:muconolactone D-isomerase
MEFLVEFDVHVPSGTPASEVERRVTAEAIAADALAEQGILVRLWKLAGEPGTNRAIGVYRSSSEALLSDLLEGLPLSDWMQITVTPLEPHPNDPAVNASNSQGVGARQ